MAFMGEMRAIVLLAVLSGSVAFADDHEASRVHSARRVSGASLLQAEVAVQSKSVENQAIEADAEPSVANQAMCEGMQGYITKVSAQDPQHMEPVRLDSAPQQAASELVEETTKDQGEPSASRAALLRNLLRALTVVVLLDIARRRCWPQEPKATAREVPSNNVEGWEALVKAALDGDLPRSEALLAKGVPLEGADVWGSTLLHAAAAGGAVPLISLLLKRGADLDARDVNDDTPLHAAARAGHAEACDALVAAGAEVEARNVQGQTPRAVAEAAEHHEVCDVLRGHLGGIDEDTDDELSDGKGKPTSEGDAGA